MGTRTRKTTVNKTTAKKTAARKPAVKKALPKTVPVNRKTVTDIRPPLPVRRKVFVGPTLTVHQQAGSRAALASAKAQLPISAWLWDGPVARLGDGTILTHTPAHAGTDQRPTFTAAIRCPHGAVHVHTIHTAQQLYRARQITALCDQRTTPAPAAPAPKPAVRALGDALTRAKSAAAETQPIPVITRVVPADTDQAKEHPAP